jgi:hypothetical protein
MKMEQTGCSEMSAQIIQTPGNPPKEEHNKVVFVPKKRVIMNFFGFRK